VTNKFASFPLTEYSKQSHLIDKAGLEREIRLRATTILSGADVPIRRFTLEGYYTFVSKKRAMIERTEVLVGLLKHANLLEHLRVRTDAAVALPIFETLSTWPNLDRLDIRVGRDSHFLNASRVRHLTLRLKPHYGPLLQWGIFQKSATSQTSKIKERASQIIMIHHNQSTYLTRPFYPFYNDTSNSNDGD
jgi:hypothetical protein